MSSWLNFFNSSLWKSWLFCAQKSKHGQWAFVRTPLFPISQRVFIKTQFLLILLFFFFFAKEWKRLISVLGKKKKRKVKCNVGTMNIKARFFFKLMIWSTIIMLEMKVSCFVFYNMDSSWNHVLYLWFWYLQKDK